MRKFVGLFVAGLILLASVIGCSGGGGGGGTSIVPALFYLRQEFDSRSFYLYGATESGAHRAKLHKVDATALGEDDTAYSIGKGMAYDEATGELFVHTPFGETKDVISTVDVKTGVLTKLVEVEGLRFGPFFLDGDNIRLAWTNSENTEIWLMSYARDDGSFVGDVKVDTDLYVNEDYSGIGIIDSNFVADTENGSVYALMTRWGGAGNQALLLKIDIADGGVELLSELAENPLEVELSHLFLKDGYVHYTVENGSDSLTIKRVPVGGGATEVAFTLDPSTIKEDDAHGINLIGDSYALNPEKTMLYFSVIIEDEDDTLVAADLASGKMKAIDRDAGYFGLAFKP